MKNSNKNVENFEKGDCFSLRIHIYCGGVSSYPNFSFNSALQKVILKLELQNKVLPYLDWNLLLEMVSHSL
jgi:hypothetical protein